MEFITFVSLNDIKEDKNSVPKPFIFFQVMTTLPEYQHINTDIYAKYLLTSKMFKNFDINKAVESFLNSPIYIGDLTEFETLSLKKNKKIYVDTRTMIKDINMNLDMLLYNSILSLEHCSYFTYQIGDNIIVNFIRY
jgi:hypothetical protein